MVSKPRLALFMLLLLILGGGMIALVVVVLDMHEFWARTLIVSVMVAFAGVVHFSGVLYKKSKD